MAPEDQLENNSGTLPLSHSPAQESGHVRRFKRRLLGKDRPWISWRKSAQAIVSSSCKVHLNYAFSFRVAARVHLRILTHCLFHNAGLNVLVLLIPIAWVSHLKEWAHGLTFARM
jgi:hypothetical protein